MAVNQPNQEKNNRVNNQPANQPSRKPAGQPKVANASVRQPELYKSANQKGLPVTQPGQVAEKYRVTVTKETAPGSGVFTTAVVAFDCVADDTHWNNHVDKEGPINLILVAENLVRP